MEIIHGGRGSGKTTKLIQLVKESGGVLVVPDVAKKRFLVDYGMLEEDQVITFMDHIKLLGTHKPYYIDSIDAILKGLFGDYCSGISLDDPHLFKCRFLNVS